MEIDDYTPKTAGRKKGSKVNKAIESLTEDNFPKPIHLKTASEMHDNELAGYVMTYHRRDGLFNDNKDEFEAMGQAMLKGSRADAILYVDGKRELPDHDWRQHQEMLAASPMYDD